MKVQCQCGAKYSFDVTPQMIAEPVRFVCPSCGFDSSAMVNEMIQREAAESRGARGESREPEVAPASAPAPVVAKAAGLVPVPPESARPRLGIARAAAAPAASAAAPVQ